MSAPILIFPDYNREFILDTDASKDGIGAVLSQVQDSGEEKVVAYASRILSKPERKYCVTRQELLAVITFIKHFRYYIPPGTTFYPENRSQLTQIASKLQGT